MAEFRREERYLVVKIDDLQPYETNFLRKYLADREIKTRECVVVEADWPIYQQTWDAVQRLAQRRPQRLDELAHQLGFCTDCGQMWEHNISEPTAVCGCKQSEWHDLTPPYMQLQKRLYEAIDRRDELEMTLREGSVPLGLLSDLADRVQDILATDEGLPAEHDVWLENLYGMVAAYRRGDFEPSQLSEAELEEWDRDAEDDPA